MGTYLPTYLPITISVNYIGRWFFQTIPLTIALIEPRAKEICADKNEIKCTYTCARLEREARKSISKKEARKKKGERARQITIVRRQR